MKYMGSKRWMLQNGLWLLIEQQAKTSTRFFDLFAGSASVAWFVATRLPLQVIATDIQRYATVLASAIIEREAPLSANHVKTKWFKEARNVLDTWAPTLNALNTQTSGDVSVVLQHRQLCAETSNNFGPIWRAYGGYYFSAYQALVFDALLSTLPQDVTHQKVALASLISCAMICAAAPGHTAQPFRPTPSAARFIFDAWHKDPFFEVERILVSLCTKYAQKAGHAMDVDALRAATTAQEGDLVFLDPPYSGVHYSRFYHVLETIARGECGPVSGAGRYPPQEERPRSDFSMRGKSELALTTLLQTLSAKGASVILTFPAGESSNGLNGDQVLEIAEGYFSIDSKIIENEFSTMGGNKKHRPARQASNEMLLSLKPR